MRDKWESLLKTRAVISTVFSTVARNFAAKPRESTQNHANSFSLKCPASAAVRNTVKIYARLLR
jgi:hypothetical protein